MTQLAPGLVREGVARLEGADKVTGRARYALEYRLEGAAVGWVVQAPVPSGRITGIDDGAARTAGGVLEVLWHGNAPRLGDAGDPELAVLQSDRVAYAGQIAAIVVAEHLEAAREAARLVRVEVEPAPHDTVLTEDHPGRYRPETVNPDYPTDTDQGDVAAALARSAVTVDATYRTPAQHNNPMEPHATTARWDGDRLTVFDSNQGATPVQRTLATLFGIPEEDVEVVSPHVGGGFGSKGTPRPTVVAAAMAARMVGRPVHLGATRQQMFAFVGYRTPTIQRVRLGSTAEGRLTAISHEVVEQTSRIKEFAEQTAVATRMLYAADSRHTSHRLVRLDLPTPSWMRAPGECPGMYALESAMDELAAAAGVDPVELRFRNEPEVDPESGLSFSSRNLVACLRLGADRFGWSGRDPRPAMRRDGPWLVGTGVAAATYPARSRPSRAAALVDAAGRFTVRLAAADIGTGARTVIGQLAAETLGVDLDRVTVEIGDSRFPSAPLAGGSMGTNSWGWAVVRSCEGLRRQLDERDGALPEEGIADEVDTQEEVAAQDDWARHGFGAHYVEARVHARTGEVRVPRMVSVFACGRIVNPLTARSQFLGGMTMGLSMALMEESLLDPGFGEWMNKDLADYHVATYADVGDLEALWIEEDDAHVNPVGTKGIGEIGIVGAAAAVTNAVWHATGIRVRDLPVRPDKLLGELDR